MPIDTPTAHFVQIHREDLAAVQAELTAGLNQTPPRVAPKFFYDALGSRLFDAITELAEYYPTRTEAAIFREHGEALAQQVPTGAVLVDLGAGSCAIKLGSCKSQARFLRACNTAGFWGHSLSKCWAQLITAFRSRFACSSCNHSKAIV